MKNDSPSCRAPDASGTLAALLDPALFRSLADPVRLQVVARLALAARPLTVGEVSDCCGVHLSGVSRHLKTLREAGVVEAAKVGREVHHALLRAPLAERLRSLADLLDAGGDDLAAARRRGA